MLNHIIDCESFLGSNSPDIIALSETNLADSFFSDNLSGKLPSFNPKGFYYTHMHGLAVYVKEGFPFLRQNYLQKTLQILTYAFNRLYLTQQCLNYFSSIDHFMSLGTVFYSILQLCCREQTIWESVTSLESHLTVNKLGARSCTNSQQRKFFY